MTDPRGEADGKGKRCLLSAEEIIEMLKRANLAAEVTLPVEKFRDLCFQAFKDTQ
jgi:hypothetical protein